MHPQVKELEAVLSSVFGGISSPDQIADLCRTDQIVGFLNNSTSCPMVKLISNKVSFRVAFTLGKKVGCGRWMVIFSNDHYVSIPSPIVCDQFSEKFDSKQYPDLIAHGREG